MFLHELIINAQCIHKYNTVKPPITDSPSTDNLRTTDSCRGTDCFCHIYSVFLTSEIRTTLLVQKDGSCTKSPSRADRDRNRGSKFRRIVNQRHLERPLSHSFTVEPLYSGHHWDQVKLSVLSRCPVFRGYSSIATGGVAQNKLRMPGNDPYLMISTWIWTAVFRDRASFSES